jgi:nitroreductase
MLDKSPNPASPAMSLVDTIYTRRSVRGFLDRPVQQETLNAVFEIAQQAPSNCNVQPWKAYVASGALKDRLSQQMVEKINQGIPPNPDYEYRGDFADDYRRKQIDCAVALYSRMGIGRSDREGRQRAVLRNYEYFGYVGADTYACLRGIRYSQLSYGNYAKLP